MHFSVTFKRRIQEIILMFFQTNHFLNDYQHEEWPFSAQITNDKNLNSAVLIKLTMISERLESHTAGSTRPFGTFIYGTKRFL